jgi:hypothetical protein
VVAYLQCYPKLININQLPSQHLEYTKRKRAVPKTLETKLDVQLLHLVALGGSLFLCDVQLPKASQDYLTRVEVPPLIDH